MIVPTYRDWSRLGLCLRALEAQRYPQRLVEILVVNNDPDDEPPPSFCLPANARLLHEHAPGSYAARNRGLKCASGELIGFTDADCIPEPDWIERAVAAAADADGGVRVAGAIRLFREPGGSRPAWWFESVISFDQQNNVRHGVAVTANLFVEKSVFETVGVFDASLFSGGDVAWNRLATEKGIPLVYAEQVVVRHPARSSMGEIFRKYRRVFGNGYLRARREGKGLPYVLRCCVPPARYGFRAWRNGQPALKVLFACSVFWGVKVLMVLEAFRISMGGIPERS